MTKCPMLVLLLLSPAARAEPGTVVRSSGIECRWERDGSGLRSLAVTDAAAGRALEIAGGFTPVLEFPGGGRFGIGPALGAFGGGETATSRSAAIGPNPHGLRGSWTVSLHDEPAHVLQTLTLTAARDLPVRGILFLDSAVEGAEVVGAVDGSVIRSGPFFLAVEHPLAQSSLGADGRVRCRLPRGNTLRSGTTWTFTFVIGTTPPGEFRRGFLRYLEARRARPYRPYVHYNSWYHLNIGRPGNHMTEAECLATIGGIGRELTAKRGVTLDAFVWDDGWDDHDSLWGFHGDFPRGFRELDRAAGAHGAAMGVWMSPWGGYSEPKQRRLRFGRAHGYETNAGGFSMAGRNYGSAFRRRCLEMMDEHGVEFFKFDGMGGGNLVSGADGEAAADIDAVLELTRALRARNPGVFISATVGTWPSPFWLLHVDSIWRQGDDTGFAGVGNGREQWITYRDAQTRANIVGRAPCFPISSLMTGGLVVGERANPGRMALDDASVRNEARAMVGSGTCLQELYIAPHLLTPPMWDAIAGSIRWLRARRAAFADVHWVGGDPAALEVYGWAGWHDGAGVLTLRNPADRALSWRLDIADALELPPGDLKSAYTLVSPYGDQRLRRLDCRVAGWREIELEPFEILSFDVAAAAGAVAVPAARYRDWRAECAAAARAAAAGFLGSWDYEHQGRRYTRTFLPDGRALLAIDGVTWNGWPDRRWRIDGDTLIVTAPGASPEPHRLGGDGRLVLPAGLGTAGRRRPE